MRRKVASDASIEATILSASDLGEPIGWDRGPGQTKINQPGNRYAAAGWSTSTPACWSGHWPS
jgi:hypothetical protein